MVPRHRAMKAFSYGVMIHFFSRIRIKRRLAHRRSSRHLEFGFPDLTGTSEVVSR